MSSPTASLNAVDKQFMIKAAQSDMTEIKTSQLALKRSTSADVKSFAQQMIKQHTDSSAKLKPLARKKNVTLPKDLGRENNALDLLHIRFSNALRQQFPTPSGKVSLAF